MPFQKPRDYWGFVDLMFRQPWVQLHRLVFADELEEWGMPRAARKQRQLAQLIPQMSCIYMVYDARQADIKGNQAARRKRDYSIKKFGIIKRKDGYRLFEFKKDGRIVQAPKGLLDWYVTNRRGFRVLSGRFPERGPRFRLSGTQTGRWSSRSPNLNGMVPATSNSPTERDNPNLIRGTIDARRSDGSLFDFRTVRGSGPRLTTGGREYQLVEMDFEGIEVGVHRRNALHRLAMEAQRNGEPGFISQSLLDRDLTAGIEVPIDLTQEQYAQLAEYALQGTREVSFGIDPELLNRDSESRARLNELVTAAARKAAEEAEVEFLTGKEQRLMSAIGNEANVRGWTIVQPQKLTQYEQISQQLMDDLEAECFNPELGVPHGTVPGEQESRP